MKKKNVLYIKSSVAKLTQEIATLTSSVKFYTNDATKEGISISSISLIRMDRVIQQ